MTEPIARLHPTAATVAVTSGKGGAGKTTTAVALAARLAADGHRTLLVDCDAPAPNTALVADFTPTVTADVDNTALLLPDTPYGFKLAAPAMFGDYRAGYGDMFKVPLWVDGIDVIVYDLPGGWTAAQNTVVERFVDTIIACSPPTAPALADHKAHLAAIARQRDAVIDGIKRSDRRRKNWDFPATRVVSAQTLATYIGTLPDGTVAEVRRLDAMPAAEIDGLFDVTVPPAVTVADLAASRAIGDIAGLCMAGGA